MKEPTTLADLSRVEYVSSQPWMAETARVTRDGSRYWEAAETTRLNEAHWAKADDESINTWLVNHLPTLRKRSIYESRQNPVLCGMMSTHSDDLWGQDGPVLQVESDDPAFNSALEDVWREWFSAPTTRQNLSGAAMGKLWTKNLWRCGEYIARIVTDPQASDPVKMRLHLCHPRRLDTPAQFTSDTRVFMGIRFDQFDRPTQYYIEDQSNIGNRLYRSTYSPWPADLIIHEFLTEEEDQARGVPLQSTGLEAIADLRDYDSQVMDASRAVADQAALLYTEHPDAELWTAPESADVERRTIRMLPPGWKPFIYSATQPAVNYPDYRSERHVDMGRPASMPRLLVRMDASKHSWASARLDMTTYRRATQCLQAWFSGSEKAVGVLNRLVDLVAAEARFRVGELRNRPDKVNYAWTWPQLDDVEPAKTAQAHKIQLETGEFTLTEILAARKKTLSSHLEELRREQAAFADAGLPLPTWFLGQSVSTTDVVDMEADSEEETDDEQQSEEENAQTSSE